MAINQVTDFAALRALTTHTFGDITFSAKRLSGDATTDGGGTFVYDDGAPTAPMMDDEATIIKPSNVGSGSPGRWLRRVDVRGPVHAEWFGAKGDGGTDDRAAIQAALTTYGRVTLLAKTYVLSSLGTLNAGIINLVLGNRVEGQGIDKTIVQMSYDPGAGVPTTATSLAAFGTTGSCDDAVVQDLTVNCGHDLVLTSNKVLTRIAVELIGQRALIRRVKAIKFGVGALDQGGQRKRATVLVVGLSGAGQLGSIQDCQVTNPGGMSIVTSAYVEVIGIQIRGASSSVLGIGGRVSGNRVFDVGHSAAQPCPFWGISFQDCQGSEIADNEVTSVDGAGIATNTGKAVDVVIRNNRLLNVNTGVALLAATTSTTLLQQHTQIVENTILLGKKTAIHASYRLYGVYLGAVAGIATGTVRFADVSIERNFIRGQTDSGVIPAGVYSGFDSQIWQRLNIQENLIETKDPVSTQLNEDHENSIVFQPTANYQAQPSNLRLHGNRCLANTSQVGPDLRLKLYDGTTAKWGPFSNRLARFLSPVFDGRVGLLYDDFVGETTDSGPQFALGWETEKTGQGSITSQPVSLSGDVASPGPGIVAITAGAGLTSDYAVLRYRSDSVILNGSVGHVLEFYAKRSAASDGVNSYDCLLGFFTKANEFPPDAPDGVYFRIRGNNSIMAMCRASDLETALVATATDNTPAWRKYRIEALKSAAGNVIDTVRFFVDGDYVGKITTHIPTDTTLTCGVRVLANSANSVARYLYLDYFQHQLVPSS